MNNDYLCYVSIGGGSCYGYGETPTEAVASMMMALHDWCTYYDLSETTVCSFIYDVAYYDGFIADHSGLYGQLPDGGDMEMRYTETPLEPCQYAMSKTPKVSNKTRRWSELNALRSTVNTKFYSTYDELKLLAFEEAQESLRH